MLAQVQVVSRWDRAPPDAPFWPGRILRSAHPPLRTAVHSASAPALASRDRAAQATRVAIRLRPKPRPGEEQQDQETMIKEWAAGGWMSGSHARELFLFCFMGENRRVSGRGLSPPDGRLRFN